jgi:hypothetical protein
VWVVAQVLSHSRQVERHVDARVTQLIGRPDPG